MNELKIGLLLLFTFANHAFAQHLDTSQYAFFNFDSSGYFQNKFPYHSVKSNLSEKESLIVEPLLNKCVKEFNIKKDEEINKLRVKYPEITREGNVIDLKLYKRQCIVAVTPNGDKVIWINFFCDAFPLDWKKEFVQVDDGGLCFFELKINLTKKYYYDFHANGHG